MLQTILSQWTFNLNLQFHGLSSKAVWLSSTSISLDCARCTTLSYILCNHSHSVLSTSFSSCSFVSENSHMSLLSPSLHPVSTNADIHAGLHYCQSGFPIQRPDANLRYNKAGWADWKLCMTNTVVTSPRTYEIIVAVKNGFEKDFEESL